PKNSKDVPIDLGSALEALGDICVGILQYSPPKEDRGTRLGRYSKEYVPSLAKSRASASQSIFPFLVVRLP
ncbi:MAG TPA: hypothetical protein PLN52_21345, partial [Opitutaceae bacterium]|nr:hypothetical protein [Opitutaceae bacterium]